MDTRIEVATMAVSDVSSAKHTCIATMMIKRDVILRTRRRREFGTVTTEANIVVSAAGENIIAHNIQYHVQGNSYCCGKSMKFVNISAPVTMA